MTTTPNTQANERLQKLRDHIAQNMRKAKWSEPGGLADVVVIPGFDAESIWVVIQPELSHAYYQGLDRKGWPQSDEDRAKKAIMATITAAVEEARKRCEAAEKDKTLVIMYESELENLEVESSLHRLPLEYIQPLHYRWTQIVKRAKVRLAQLTAQADSQEGTK